VISRSGGKVAEARIVLSGVAPTPFRATAAEEAIKGQIVDAKLAADAANRALTDARPMTNNAYKVGLAKTLVTRSILEAWGQG
jgi:xanthine dehydrogenase YagS FAD-binding subunit